MNDYLSDEEWKDITSMDELEQALQRQDQGAVDDGFVDTLLLSNHRISVYQIISRTIVRLGVLALVGYALFVFWGS